MDQQAPKQGAGGRGGKDCHNCGKKVEVPGNNNNSLKNIVTPQEEKQKQSQMNKIRRRTQSAANRQPQFLAAESNQFIHAGHSEQCHQQPAHSDMDQQQAVEATVRAKTLKSNSTLIKFKKEKESRNSNPNPSSVMVSAPPNLMPTKLAPRQANIRSRTQRYATSPGPEPSIPSIEKQKQKSAQKQQSLSRSQKKTAKVAAIVEQLKQMQSRLNKQLKKRTSHSNPSVAVLQNRNTSMNEQLTNAQKRCRIYKKQLESLKLKYNTFNEDKVNQLSASLKQLRQAYDKCEAQNRQLKKAVKRYQGMFCEVGNGEYLSLRQQLQVIKQQNKKLKQQNKKQEQQSRVKHLMAVNQRSRAKRQSERLAQIKRKQEQRVEKQTQEHERRKQRERVDKIMKEIEQLKQKSAKDKEKIDSLSTQNLQIEEHIKNMQQQLQSKKSEIEQLKLKLVNPSMDNESEGFSNLLPSSIVRNQQAKGQQDCEVAEIVTSRLSEVKNKHNQTQQKEKSTKTNTAQNPQLPSSMAQDPNPKQAVLQSQPQSRLQTIEPSDKPISKRVDNPKRTYPLKLQIGQSNSESLKWNHFAYGSAIKEINAKIHPNGHIQQMFFRYQKGVAGNEKPQGNYLSLICAENCREMVKSIEAGFENGILAYLKAVTSLGRQWRCGKQIALPSNHVVVFGEKDNEYPWAMFGEGMNEGVTRLGCFVNSFKDI